MTNKEKAEEEKAMGVIQVRTSFVSLIV